VGDREIRTHYDELSAAYQRDRNHRFFGACVDRYVELLGTSPGRLLEVGCGTGAYVAELLRRGIDAHGVDFSPQMCEVARASCRAAGVAAEEAEALIACADCEESLGFPGSFASIALVDSWESFPNPGKVIRHVEAALEPGGRLLILTPNFTFKPLLWTLETLRIKKLRPAFVYGSSRVSRTRRLVGGGFRELEIGSFFFGLERYFLYEKKGA
jgi:SAM-dependent methyltransferase